jgi:hypothetical protein
LDFIEVRPFSETMREASIALRNNRHVPMRFPTAGAACLQRRVTSVHEIEDRHIMVLATIH